MLMSKKPYLFDTHKFDSDIKTVDESLLEDDQEEIIVVPSYTEEELAAAKEEAYKRGKAEGFLESEEGYTSQIQNLTKTLNHNLANLLQAEELRKEQFQSETLKSVKALFENAFPALKEKHGLGEIESLIEDVLAEHLGDSKITIHVAPEYSESIETYIKSKFQADENTLEVVADKEIAKDDCRIAWDNGGAIRDTKVFEDKIMRFLQDDLAHKVKKSQDTEVETEHTDYE